ncbi:FTR1 family iron permease [Lederbergia citri]|uniref:FTR1 family protein n=1 Tax=Lederbergia citri TaxID=2833580 RepID=A0A942YF58_9BACI|nr:FTR1 family protein [Lederbergia citri]MBS4194658.1 FTR1 family protein [Lederbergia citri]
MIDSLLLSLREGLEAALIIGIILAQLVRINRKGLTKFVYIGAILGFIVSAIGGIIGFNEAQEAAESSEELFEGIIMLLSAGLIAYFILWLHRNHGHSSMTKKVTQNTNAIGLFMLSFLSVFREGMELVIFNLTKITESAYTVATGSILGIVIAILISFVVFKTSIRFNLSILFKILGVILILVGGEMFGEGLVKIFEGGEILETLGVAVFIVLSFIIFFQQDLKRLFKNRVVAK